jgi:hypothetical protein
MNLVDTRKGSILTDDFGGFGAGSMHGAILFNGQRSGE